LTWNHRVGVALVATGHIRTQAGPASRVSAGAFAIWGRCCRRRAVRWAWAAADVPGSAAGRCDPDELPVGPEPEQGGEHDAGVQRDEARQLVVPEAQQVVVERPVASWISRPIPFSTAKMTISRRTPVRCLSRKDQ